MLITTGEIIANPVEFLQANPDITANMPRHVGQVVIAKNIDLIIDPIGPFSGLVQRNRAHAVPTTTFFGDLHTQSTDLLTPDNTETYLLRWYPSAATLNQLSEELGKRPGEDALKFEPVPYGHIPDTQFREYLHNGIHPQATAPHYFDHDRGAIHVPGTLAMPPHVARTVIRLGWGGGTEVPKFFNDMSAVYSSAIRGNCNADGMLPTFRDALAAIDPADVAAFRKFWQTGRSYIPSDQRFISEVAEQAKAHLTELHPRIRILQRARQSQN